MHSLSIEESKQLIQSSSFAQLLEDMYGNNEYTIQKQRYLSLLESFRKEFGEGKVSLFSAPGRTEISGNHTDHNYGKVLAGSINYDTIAVSRQVNEDTITILSESYTDKFIISITDLKQNPGDNGTAALIRGICAGFLEFGFKVGGLDAYISSNVLSASGLSSSASFEMLLCSIMNDFYNEGSIDPITLAKIGQYAENHYWNKPSGLLDQMACAIGGAISIDFGNPNTPLVEQIDYDFSKDNFSLVIVNTGGNHADLTDAYASVPNEMFSVAKALGKKVLMDLSIEDILGNLCQLREKLGDRAVLRALHFYKENERVDMQVEALKSNDFDRFLILIKESGNSSWKWLQNCYLNQEPREQAVSVALALTEIFIDTIGRGACRIHGGGFAGVILAIIPNTSIEQYEKLIRKTLGTDLFKINIRKQGAICLNRTIAAVH